MNFSIKKHLCLKRAKKVFAGFILLETLAAISILSIVLPVVLDSVTKSVSVGSYAKNQLIAHFLAAEGLEIIRSQRDNNMLNAINGGGALWDDVIFTQCANLLGGCAVDIGYGAANVYINRCDGACTGRLNINDALGIYADSENHSGVGWTPSAFTRIVSIAKGTSAEELLVKSRVTYDTQYGVRYVELSEYIYHWLQ